MEIRTQNCCIILEVPKIRSASRMIYLGDAFCLQKRWVVASKNSLLRKPFEDSVS